MPKGKGREKFPDAYEEKRRPSGEVAGDDEDIPRAVEEPELPPQLTAVEDKPKRTRRKKVKSGDDPVPVPAEMVAKAADAILLGASGAYLMIRDVELAYDAAHKEYFTSVLGQWAEASGFELPLYLQVAVAGAICLGPAIVNAEQRRSAILSQGGPNALRARRANGAASAVRPAPADRGGGEAGERKDVLPDPLAGGGGASGLSS